MKKIFQKINHKTIFWFYLLTSVYSILWYYFLQPSVVDFEGFLYFPSTFLNIYDFNLYAVINFLNDLTRADFYESSMLQLNTTFPLLIVVSCLIFKISKYRDSRLLRYLISISILIMTVGFVFSLAYGLGQISSLSLSRIAIFVLFTIKTIFLLIVHYQVIKFLNKDDVDYVITDLKNLDPSLIASKGRRFMNYFIDCFPRIIISFLVISVLLNFSRRGMMSGDLGGAFGEYVFRFFIVFLSVLVVYFISERLFLRSPAKFLTNTRVIYTKEKNKTASIAVRSLVRLIPILDSFSFLFGNKKEGFHDAWSHTVVVKNKTKGIAYGWYFIIFPLVMFLTFVPKMTIDAIDSYQHKKVYEQYRENKIKNLKDLGLKLEKGQLIEGTNYLYHIDSTDETNIYLSFVQKEGVIKPFDINNYSTNNYGDDLSKKLYKRTIPIQDVLNGEKSVQFLFESNEAVINDVSLRESGRFYNQNNDEVLSYNLNFAISNRSSLYISHFESIDGNLELKTGRSSGNSLSLKVENKDKTMLNQEYKVLVTISNRKSGKSSTYHVIFTKYGVLNYYKVD